MANYKSLRRYYLIIEKLREGRNASFRSINKHLKANDVDISLRTLQRDLAQMRADFGVDILYNKDVDGYYIDETSSLNLPAFYNFLELTITSGLLEEHLKRKGDLLKYIQFESLESFKGHENLKQLMEAILLKRWIRFTYNRFVEDRVKQHEIIPCVLKRYQNRWYVVGKLSYGRLATFGLDRMSSLKLLTKVFTQGEVIIPDSLNDVVGLDYSGNRERVVIRAIPLQAKYLKALPLHHSQKIVSENKEGTTFEYQLIPNFELVQALMRLGDQVKVIEPGHLRTQIIDVLTSALRSYKK